MVANPHQPHGAPRRPRDETLKEFRRVPQGLDPDQVHVHILGLQARIRLLESQSRRTVASAVVDGALHQAEEIRQQALQSAERIYAEVIRAADEQAARRRQQAEHDAQALLAQAQAELRVMLYRIASLLPADSRQRPTGQQVAAARTPSPRPSAAPSETVAPDRDGATPFRLPAWLEE